MSELSREVQPSRGKASAFACTSCERASLARVTGGSCRFVRSLCSKKKREEGKPFPPPPALLPRVAGRCSLVYIAYNGQIIERISSVRERHSKQELIVGFSQPYYNFQYCVRQTVYFAVYVCCNRRQQCMGNMEPLRKRSWR